MSKFCFQTQIRRQPRQAKVPTVTSSITNVQSDEVVACRLGSQKEAFSTSKTLFYNKHLAQWLLAIVSIVVSTVQGSLPAGAETRSPILNQAAYSYSNPANAQTFSNLTNALSTEPLLVDPLGQITGCAGEVLSSYQGFSVGLYEPAADSTGTEIGRLVELTQTAVPQSNNLPLGLPPNTQNSNPFSLSTSNPGTYNFLLDLNRGQLETGKTYILLVNPPANSIYTQRRFRMVVRSRQGNVVAYTASSLDGMPLEASDGRTSVDGTLTIGNAAQVGLVFAALNLRASVCQAQAIQIIKVADRSAAEPGDTVIYRVSVKNLSSTPVQNVTITDTLPLGFKFFAQSVRGEFAGAAVNISARQTGSTVTFAAQNFALPPGKNGGQPPTLNIAYAAQLTPDAIRGSGQNSAIAYGRRADNSQVVKDGPAIHRLRVRNGILSDCGTIIGRVFVDNNFDGEQQPGEPGVPNAVVFLDDGTRITTDVNGLYSIANVLSGYRTGVLDLTSVPGYTLAPNIRFIERNSQSRLVHLEPGGLVRMNFAVTPAAQPEAGKP